MLPHVAEQARPILKEATYAEPVASSRTTA
jgi:hypothetical protein